ncbi:MAG: Pvc16 family protein [Janthinobacterium lividum]
MIRDVDETLSNLLSVEMSKIPGSPRLEKEQITFDAPPVAEAVSDKKPRLNLHLHSVSENRALRESGLRLTRKPGENTVGVRRAPINLDLSYLLTAYAGSDAAMEHRLLSDALGILLRCEDVPAEYLSGVLEGPSLTLTVAQPDHLGAADPSALWQALGGRMRTALSLVATAEYNPYETRWTKVVRELVVGIGVGIPPHGPGRPLDLSSIRVSAAGLVLDQADEKPLEGVTVRAEGWEGHATTDERGFFSLLNLPPGPRTLCVQGQCYARQEFQTTVPAQGHPDQLEPCVIALHRLSDADLVAETAARTLLTRNSPAEDASSNASSIYHASLSGMLRLEDGRPAPYICVHAGGKQAVTDADGVYCFFDLPAGPHTVTADLPESRAQNPIKVSETDKNIN